MESLKKNIITPVPLGLIPSQRSYWATHFFSILQCLDQHKNLEFSPRRLDLYPTYSLAVLRGCLPSNFFGQIERYIENWGVQYFLANFFNQKLGGNVVEELISRIERAYGVSFNNSLEHFSFHVSGNDSSLSSKLSEEFSEVFPSNLNDQYPAVDTLIAQSDLCLILSNSQDIKVGLFGEIEGLYGNKLRTESYWGKKQNFCIFGIGVVDGIRKVVYFEEGVFNGIYRVNLFFERTNFVVSDFKNALGAFRTLFLEGPGASFYSRDEEFDFFINKIKLKWNSNVYELMNELKLYISSEDVVGLNGGVLEIVTDLQSAPKG
ncbi:hypothetical protein [Nitrosomonas sp.]|uniref:hypothetical protein n=1 Tax=Nitrosomonas sp. TaxID=42353 RepID=UPI001D87DC3A|nr:hypothetical protein [Nitrosomonas sp.]MBX9637959.1 hypothetical protein [Nitrosomonas sp.]MBY0484728.1 hypothetical protein [Nitrosomonas sp.]